MDKNLFIFGQLSTAYEIYETARLLTKFKDYKIYFVISDEENKLFENSVTETELKSNDLKGFYIISISQSGIRKKCLNLAEHLKLIPVSVISEKAYISVSARIGKGVYIAPNVSVSSNAVIDDHNIINFNSTIGHESRISSNCIINPGVRISGNVKLGENVHVGANSFVFQDKSIGKNTIVDAMTYVDKDIADEQICSSKTLRVFKRIIAE